MADEKQQGVSMVALTRFDLNDGRRMTKDAEFLAENEAQAVAYESRGLANRGGSAKDSGMVTAEEAETMRASAAPAGPSLKGLEKSWTLAQDPETYLRAHPDGPNAEAAQKIVSAREAAEKSKEK